MDWPGCVNDRFVELKQKNFNDLKKEYFEQEYAKQMIADMLVRDCPVDADIEIEVTEEYLRVGNEFNVPTPKPVKQFLRRFEHLKKYSVR